MTVGIGATFDGEDVNEPAVVLVADRMVTTGAVEHEHANGKLETISAGDPAVAAAASGTLSYADELYYHVGERVVSDDPASVEDVANIFVDEMHKIVKKEANDRILSDFGLELEQLTNDGVPLSEQHVGEFLKEITELKNNIQSNTTLLIAGVDDRHGAQLLELRDGSTVRHRSLGYQCIGSGAGSANLTFMRNGYSPNTLQDSVILAADAKNQAGEAQGVGDDMDIAVVGNRVNILDDDTVGDIQSLIEDVRDAEQEARENAISDEVIDLNR